MALVVETGSGNDPTANSYSDLASIRGYAADRGVILSPDDAVLTPMAIMAMDYIEALRARFKGVKAQATQPLQWPRACVVMDGSPLLITDMPPELAKAQAQLCIEQFNGVVISPNKSGFAVMKTRVDVIEVQYSAGNRDAMGVMDPTPIFPIVDNLLDPLLWGEGMLVIVRV